MIFKKNLLHQKSELSRDFHHVINDGKKQALTEKKILAKAKGCVKLILQLKTRFFYLLDPIEKCTNLCHFAIFSTGLIQ